MKVRGAIVAAALVMSLSSCSNSTSLERKGESKVCEQETKNKFFGITYSTDRSVRTCGPQE